MLDVTLAQAGPIELDAHLQCAAGELLALVGPSGAGKSTVLRAIAGLTRVSRAAVRVGQVLWQDTHTGVWLDARERRVGMVFQSYALFPHLTVLDNVAEPLFRLPRDERHALAANALARVNLSGFESRRPGQLSGGQQQRVALARALVREPEVLLLDEPFAAVDQTTRERLYEELAELRAGLQIPVVLVTHSLHEAELLADRMVVLRRGKTLQSGRPAEVLSRPESEEVARLVGFSNVFTSAIGRVDAAAGLAWLSLGKAELPVALRSGMARGQTVRWGIASGDVGIIKDGRRAMGDGHLVEATLERAVVLGESVRLGLRVEGAGLIKAVVTQRFAERADLTEGKAMRLELPAGRLLVFEPAA
jgi:molybdate transport system ATP-binding protein